MYKSVFHSTISPHLLKIHIKHLLCAQHLEYTGEENGQLSAHMEIHPGGTMMRHNGQENKFTYHYDPREKLCSGGGGRVSPSIGGTPSKNPETGESLLYIQNETNWYLE